MATKIRLQRHGRKRNPFYYIVVADSRARRDGNFIEKLGTYNPVKNPTIIELDVDATVSWLEKGAEPTKTARAILSREGALYKKHLKDGVKKGAFGEEELTQKFNNWLEAKKKAILEKASLELEKKAEKKAKLIEELRIAAEAKLAAEKAAQEEVDRLAAEKLAQEEADRLATAELAEKDAQEEANKVVAEEVVEEKTSEETTPSEGE